jgi:hypothetical protein
LVLAASRDRHTSCAKSTLPLPSADLSFEIYKEYYFLRDIYRKLVNAKNFATRNESSETISQSFALESRELPRTAQRSCDHHIRAQCLLTDAM